MLVSSLCGTVIGSRARGSIARQHRRKHNKSCLTPARLEISGDALRSQLCTFRGVGVCWRAELRVRVRVKTFGEEPQWAAVLG